MPTSSDNPFLLVQSANTEITKASLSSLIQHKMKATQTYPAMVSEMVNGVAFVEVFPPILRKMKEDHPDLVSSTQLRLHANVRVGEGILLQAQQGQWGLSTTLTPEVYAETLEKAISDRLLLEGESRATLQARRASKRLLEQWLAISPSESTPWGVPGRMENGQKMLSKKILQWCVNQTGRHFQQRIQSQLPTPQDWGTGNHYFSMMLDADTEQFLPVAITQDEHRSLIELWSDLFRQPPQAQVPTVLENIAPPNTSVVPNESQTPVLTQPVATVENISLPTGMIEMARSFHLPLPQGTIPPEISTLAAWTEGDHPILKERALDFFLMLLAGGDMVRSATGLMSHWNQWHQQTDPVDQLCTLVQEGEELAAIRSLIGKPYLDTTVARAVSDQLIFRWKRRLIQTHQLPDNSLGHSLPPKPSIIEFRRNMRLMGMQCADTWLDQLLFTLQIAPHMGMMVTLVGDAERAELLMQVLSRVFDHAEHNNVRLPRQRSQLFGKPSSNQSIYLHSDLTLAIRKGAYRARYGEIGYWNPHFVLMQNVKAHSKRSGLSIFFQQMYFGDGVQLYESSTHEQYLHEWEELTSQDSLSPLQAERRDELEGLFSPENVGGREMTEGWRLHADTNTVLFGLLESEQMDEQPMDLVKRSLLIELPQFSINLVKNQLNERVDLTRLPEQKRTYHPKQTWTRFPIVREQMMALLDIFHGSGFTVGDLMAKQISFYLSAAESWAVADSPLLTHHVFHAVVLPQLQASSNQLLEMVDEATNLPHLAPQLRLLLNKLRRTATGKRGATIRGIDVMKA